MNDINKCVQCGFQPVLARFGHRLCYFCPNDKCKEHWTDKSERWQSSEGQALDSWNKNNEPHKNPHEQSH